VIRRREFITLIGGAAVWPLAAQAQQADANVTGIMPYVAGLPSKQLELAREIVPGARKIGVLNDPIDIKAAAQWEEIEATAAKIDVKIAGADVSAPEAVEPAFRALKAEGVDVVIVLQANFLILDRARIAAAALATRLPIVCGYREQVEVGGLISYGVNLDACFHRAATYVAKLLKGTPLAELPIEFPTRLELLINLKTGKVLGLEIPATLLARADEVIE
jgi:putative ABC transport system substrate-binding protein